MIRKNNKGTYNERVPLTGENLDRVHGDGFDVDAVDLDNGEVVALNGKDMVGIAREREQAEAVALALGDIDHGQRRVSITTGETTETVDESRIRSPKMSQSQTLLEPFRYTGY